MTGSSRLMVSRTSHSSLCRIAVRDATGALGRASACSEKSSPRSSSGSSPATSDAFCSPARDPMGFVQTVVFGIIGSLVGYFVFTKVLGIGDDDKFDLGGIIGADHRHDARAAGLARGRRPPTRRPSTRTTNLICGRLTRRRLRRVRDVGASRRTSRGRLRRAASASSPSSGKQATPTAAWRLACTPSSSSGAANAASTRSARLVRAALGAGRGARSRTRRRRCARPCRARARCCAAARRPRAARRHPAAWPKRSLTALKPSRSSIGHRPTMCVRSGARERDPEHPLQRAPVGEAGEVVGVGLGADALLALHAAGHVDVGAERAVRLPVRLRERARVDLDPQRRAVAADDLHQHAAHGLSRQRPAHGRAVVGRAPCRRDRAGRAAGRAAARRPAPRARRRTASRRRGWRV